MTHRHVYNPDCKDCRREAVAMGKPICLGVSSVSGPIHCAGCKGHHAPEKAPPPDLVGELVEALEAIVEDATATADSEAVRAGGRRLDYEASIERDERGWPVRLWAIRAANYMAAVRALARAKERGR